MTPGRSRSTTPGVIPGYAGASRPWSPPWPAGRRRGRIPLAKTGGGGFRRVRIRICGRAALRDRRRSLVLRAYVGPRPSRAMRDLIQLQSRNLEPGVAITCRPRIASVSSKLAYGCSGPPEGFVAKIRHMQTVAAASVNDMVDDQVSRRTDARPRSGDRRSPARAGARRNATATCRRKTTGTPRAGRDDRHAARADRGRDRDGRGQYGERADHGEGPGRVREDVRRPVAASLADATSTWAKRRNLPGMLSTWTPAEVADGGGPATADDGDDDDAIGRERGLS